jgi:hypothetical protein
MEEDGLEDVGLCYFLEYLAKVKKGLEVCVLEGKCILEQLLHKACSRTLLLGLRSTFLLFEYKRILEYFFLVLVRMPLRMGLSPTYFVLETFT